MMGARVLQLLLSLHPGGTERLVLELVRRLNADTPMAICCLDDPGAWATDVEAEGIVVTPLYRQPGFRPALGRKVAEAARRHQATVIHAHHYSPFVYGALSRFWGATTNIIYTEHGRLSDSGPSAKRRTANRVLGRLASRVFTVSRELRLHIVDEGFDSGKVAVIYNGISLGAPVDAAQRVRARSRLDVADDVTVVVTVARLDPVKDLGTLIRSVAQCPSSRLMLIVIGDGAEREGLVRVAAESGCADRVRFLGHREDAREWLAGCDVYANSSISEGISLTILEAMAAGLPVVATAAGGTPEIVNASCGRLVPSRDVGAMAGALAELAGSPSLRTTLGTAARAKVEAQFTIERMAAEYRATYRELSQCRAESAPGPLRVST